MILDCLPVRTIVARRFEECGVQCPHCGNAETGIHLFRDCAFAAEVWEMCEMGRVRWLAGQGVRDWLMEMKSQIGISGLVLALHVCFSLWTAHNKLIFDGHAGAVEQTAGRALSTYRELVSSPRFEVS